MLTGEAAQCSRVLCCDHSWLCHIGIRPVKGSLCSEKQKVSRELGSSP